MRSVVIEFRVRGRVQNAISFNPNSRGGKCGLDKYKDETHPIPFLPIVSGIGYQLMSLIWSFETEVPHWYLNVSCLRIIGIEIDDGQNRVLTVVRALSESDQTFVLNIEETQAVIIVQRFVLATNSIQPPMNSLIESSLLVFQCRSWYFSES